MNRGFIAVEALVGLVITIASCLILVIAFENMNDFSKRQQDQLNAHLAFIKIYKTGKNSLTINNNKYIVLKENEMYWVKNVDRGTKYKIEKN